MKFLLSAINGVGLGHVARLLAVARELRRRVPEAEFLFLTSSEASSVIWQEGFASVKIPSWVSTREKLIDVDDWKHLNMSLAATVVSSFRPDVLIADSFPSGESGELMPALSIIDKKILVLDYLPQFLKRVAYVEQIALYNLVLIPYAHGEVELSAAPEAQVKWVGPVIFRGKEESPSREAARRLLRLNEDQLCFLVSQGGGGGTGFDKVMAWLYRIAERYPEIQFVEAVPPLTPRHNAEETPANLSPLRHFPLVDYLNAFDAAISASGANSSTELVCFGVPTIWLPVGSTETTGQNIRAEKLVSRGLGIAVERFDDQALCNAIDNLLRPEYSHEMREKMLNQPAPNGAQKSADEICKWLAG